MTNPDLERELEELLPCQYGCCETTPPRECDNCVARPGIAAYVQRKIEEAREDERVQARRDAFWRSSSPRKA